MKTTSICEISRIVEELLAYNFSAELVQKVVTEKRLSRLSGRCHDTLGLPVLKIIAKYLFYDITDDKQDTPCT